MNTPASGYRRQRIEELEWIIDRRESDRELRDDIVELQGLWIPEDMMDNIFSFDELYGRFHEHWRAEIRFVFMEWLHSKMKPSLDNPVSIPRKILANIEKTRKSSRVLLRGDVQSDVAYQTLEDLQDAIWDNPGALTDFDEWTQEMWKEWASNFVEGVKEDFESRRRLHDSQPWGDVIWYIPLKEQYKILSRIHRSKDVREKIFREICTILPSCMWHEFDWWSVEDIVEASLSQNTK